MISAVGSEISTSGISQDGGCHKKGNLVGDKKPLRGSCLVCEQRGKGEFFSWTEVLLSAHPDQDTHTHMQARTQAGSVEWLNAGSQPSPSCEEQHPTWEASQQFGH